MTGGLAAGKTLALDHFRRLGAVTIDTDDIARAQARPGGSAYRALVRSFGESVVRADGQLDRSALAKVVFKDSTKRRKLERITHPLVLKEMRRQIRSSVGVVFAAIPLLFEGNYSKEFDLTMTIEAPESLRLARAAKRDPGGRAAATARLRAQLSDRDRARRADIVVANAGKPADFRRALGEYYRALALIERSA